MDDSEKDSLQDFLANQQAGKSDPQPEELQRLFEHTRNSPGQRGLDTYTKAGIGIVIFLVAVRLLLWLF